MPLESINPATGEKIRSFAEHSEKEISGIVLEAEDAFRSWRQKKITERAEKLKAAAVWLRSHQEPYARLMAEEMGKPLAQGRAEIEKCAGLSDFYAKEAEKFLAPEPVATDASKSFVSFEPLGIVLAIMPWNFPFWQAFRAAVPALAAGNALLLKHAANVSGCALAIEETFKSSGLPSGLFRTLLVSSNRVAALIEHPFVRAVTLTGSTPAGKAVASKAGEGLKKTVLELGGSDPYVILEDADLEAAAETCVNSRLINSGQSCIAAKRFIVVEAVQKKFEGLFAEKMRSKKMGPPEENVDLGPLARFDLRDGLHRQVQKSVEQGAKLLLGGKIPNSKGAFYPPTVLCGVRKGMPAYDEELFGPVASILAAKNEADAIRLANDSIFGLGAAVFTRDLVRGERMARELEAGACFINTFVRSDPRLPFGGIKESGYGRELSVFGIREFVNVKTVYVK